MKFMKWFLYAIAFGAFVWYVFLRQNVKTESTNMEEPAIASNVDDATDINSDDDSFVDENIQPDEVFDDASEETSDESSSNEESPVVEESEVNESKGVDLTKKYLIVIGSFGVKSNAEKVKQRIRNEGKAAEVKYINGLHRVIPASTDDRTDAKNLRAHFTHIYKEQAFILEN
jgi:cell division protein FtsN